MPRWLWWLPPAGLAFVFLYALSEGFFTRDSLRALGVSVLASGGALMVGALLGFLFGIPRTLQGERPPDIFETPTEGHKGTAYGVNTNLEQISDWLTKILVGVGLVQLGSIITAFGELADSLGPAMGGGEAGRSFALGMVVYFLVSGFLVAYLWTRLYLPGSFARADAQMLKSYVDTSLAQMEQTVDERVGGVERDVEALSLAERQLDLESDPVPSTELNAAVVHATPAVKAQIFTRARGQRSASWRTNKELMERTIPLFQALIASDRDGRYHRNFAQLAFALKDKRQPDLAGAIAALDQAIEIRGAGGGFPSYEFNRAAARIGPDPSATPDELRDAIVADLKVAARSRLWRAKMDEPGPILAWLQRNDIAIDR